MKSFVNIVDLCREIVRTSLQLSQGFTNMVRGSFFMINALSM